MTLRDRIGIDVGRRLRLEEAISWAAAHDVRYIDIQLDTADNVFTSFDDARAAGIRQSCQNTTSISASTPSRPSMSPNIRPLWLKPSTGISEAMSMFTAG